MIALVAEIHSVDSQLHFYLSKKQQETVEHLKHPPNRTERKKIDNCIHLCKPMVTLSLKKYVNSNEEEFQPNIFLFFIALSAIEPVVYDLFLVRLKTDNKELEVQRMFIVQTVFELVRYNKVLKLLTLIVGNVRSEVDKWKRLSRLIIDVLLAHLQSNVLFFTTF
ncbi:unnamed protein product [Rotaria sp. Silwood1]|nr:unnamed protein product [Rotaria sp. Silwood1]